MFDLLVINNFLDAATRADIVMEMRSAAGGPATVYGKETTGVVEVQVRKATRIVVSAETRDRVMRELWRRKDEIASHFRNTISQCEEPQFLRYEPGDFFIPHQDGNTPLIRDESRLRKLSIVLFLNPQSTDPACDGYAGGSLVLHGAYPDYDLRQPVANDPGTLVAFPAETTHEVVPVTQGERYTIVSWYR